MIYILLHFTCIVDKTFLSDDEVEQFLRCTLMPHSHSMSSAGIATNLSCTATSYNQTIDSDDDDDDDDDDGDDDDDATTNEL
jgi:hypothetical protein